MWDPGDYEPDPDDPEPVEVPSLTVEWTDPQVVAVLYGPHGEVLTEWLDRDPAGFAQPRSNE